MGKSPFSGKSYNEVLTQNRACEFKLDGPEYSKVNSQIHELIVGLLEKDPTKRLTPNQALCSDIFNDQLSLADYNDDDEMTNKSLAELALL